MFIEEARRLVEREHVDAIIGGASVVAREVARLYPEVPFMSAFWDEQEVTLRHPAPNLYRFTPDNPQLVAGLGAYAYRTLGWRRAAVLAPDQPWGWQPAAGFMAEFCALGGTIVTRAYRDAERPDPGVAERATAQSPDGVAAFVVDFDGPTAVLRDLISHLDDPARQLVLWAPSIEDDALRSSLGSKLDGVASTSWLPAGPPTAGAPGVSGGIRPVVSRHSPASPRQSRVISYYDASEALLTAIEHVGGDLSDGRSRLRRGARPHADRASGRRRSPRRQPAGGARHPDRAVRRRRRRERGRWSQSAPTRDVEQTYGGLLSATPPPSKASQPCRKATPPPWAR